MAIVLSRSSTCEPRPTWLAYRLDRAVWAAYGWDDPDPDAVEEDTILARLLALNQERANWHVLS
ncbi:MAG: hypothetical protein M3Q71_10245 [Chloroflexota bacterium]|nr:hypothetical protein [Chloroflexota bacterium]